MLVGSNTATSSALTQWNQKLLFEILDNIHDLVLVLDSDTTIVYANQAYAELLGVPIQKVLGRRLDQIEPNAPAIEVLHKGTATYNSRSYLYSVGIDVVGSCFPLFEGERIIGCVAIFNTISQTVQLTTQRQVARVANSDPAESMYDLKGAVAKLERELIATALANHHNNRSSAMRALGISRGAFYEKLHRYHLDNY